MTLEHQDKDRILFGNHNRIWFKVELDDPSSYMMEIYALGVTSQYRMSRLDTKQLIQFLGQKIKQRKGNKR